jgi:hypothetical protein
VEDVQEQLQVSERRTCQVLEQPRSTQRQEPKVSAVTERLRTRITELACRHGRYGYRRITVLLRTEGWQVNHNVWHGCGIMKGRKCRTNSADEDGCSSMMVRVYDFVQHTKITYGAMILLLNAQAMEEPYGC